MHIELGDQEHPAIFEAQRILQLLNLYPFGIDGKFGAGTQKAVGVFQDKHDMEASGVLDKTTLDKLKEVGQELELAPAMPPFELSSILEAYEAKGYTIYEEQYKLNMLGIRKDDYFDNMFSDRFVVFWKNENMDWEMRQFEWTTMPGTQGHGGVFNPLTVHGITGVAVLEEGQYQDAWHFFDDFSNFHKYPSFLQVLPVKIKRDNTRDAILDYDVPKQNGLFGINIHRMSGQGQNQKYVNSNHVRWSLGCQGAPEPIFRELVNLARAAAKHHGYRFTYTLMKRTDITASRGLESGLEDGHYFTSQNLE